MKSIRSRRFTLLLPGVFLAVLAGGCAGTGAVRVKPWEHAALADYTSCSRTAIRWLRR